MLDEKEKQAEIEEEKETPDTETAGIEEPETTEEEETKETEEETPAEGEISETEEEKKEALVPSWRLREEAEKRRKAEEELQKLKSQAKTLSDEEIEEQFLQRVEEVGYAKAYAELSATLTEKILQEKLGNLTQVIGDQQLELNLQKLQSELPELNKYAPEIKKRLAKMDLEIKMNPEAIKTTYYRILGEQVAKGKFKKEVEKEVKERLLKDKKIITDTQLGEPKGGQPPATGLTAEQEAERKRLGLKEESYLKLLQDMQAKDKQEGKEPRKTVYQLKY